MTIKDNIETVEYIDDIYPSHFDEHDIVRCEIQEAIQSGDWDRARQLASLIDITIQQEADMTLTKDFDMDMAIRVELTNYDYVKLMLEDHDETSHHHPYLVEELLDCKNNLMGAGFYLLEWNKD